MHQLLVLVGNLGGDPNKRMAGETPVTNFSMATSKTYNNRDGEKITETTWFKVAVWGKMADACAKYLKKGNKVYVEGELTPDKSNGNPKVFETKDGGHGASYEVKANVVRFLSSKSESDKSTENEEDEVEATDESEW